MCTILATDPSFGRVDVQLFSDQTLTEMLVGGLKKFVFLLEKAYLR